MIQIVPEDPQQSEKIYLRQSCQRMFRGIQLQIFFASLIFVKVRLYCISEECLFYCSTSSNYCFPLGSDPTIDSNWHILNESMKICVHFKVLFPFAFAFEGNNIFIRRITIREVWKKIL